MKKSRKFPKARNTSLPLFLTSESKASRSRHSASECKNKNQFSGTPRAPTSRRPMGLGKGSLGFVIPAQSLWQTQHCR